MSLEFRDLCILIPEYEVLQALVQAGRSGEMDLEPGQAFSMKMLLRKGLAELRLGHVVPTALGLAAARARKAGVDAVAVYLTAVDLAAAAATLDQPAQDP